MAVVSKTNTIYFVCVIVAAIVMVIFRGEFLAALTNREKQSEYDLIKKYLLNESPLYGYKRPKIWVHSTYAYNERLWKSYRERGSYDLNQPYLHLTIRTIINHCGNDFNVCLIDDDTFGKIIPSWTLDIKAQPTPVQQKWREYGMAMLVYFYGGMVVPNSFICTRNLMELYRQGVNAQSQQEIYPSSGTRMFVVEKPNMYCDRLKDVNGPKLFLPDVYFYGAPKNHSMVQKLCDFLKPDGSIAFYSGDSEFVGRTGRWLHNQRKTRDDDTQKDDEVVYVLSGEHTGVKTAKQNPVTIEHLLRETFIDYDPDKLFGVYLPSNDILSRTHYEYFAKLSSEDIMLRSNLMASRYLQKSMVDSSDLHALYKSQKENKVESVVVL